MVLRAPDGNRTLVLEPSSEWPMIVTEVPEHLAIFPKDNNITFVSLN